MTTLAERIANPQAKVDIKVESTRTRMFTGRRFDIVAYKSNGETVTYHNVVAAGIENFRAELKKQGYYRVDKIEVNSNILENGKRRSLRFDGNHKLPEKLPTIVTPDAIPTVGNISLPWDVVSNTSPAFLVPEPKKLADDRIKAHAKLMAKEARKNHSKERHSDNLYRLYSTGRKPKLVFMGTESEVLFAIMNNLVNVAKIQVVEPKEK